jgi:hypothetical protein
MKFSTLDHVKALSRGSDWRKARNEHIKKETFCQCCGRCDKLEVHHYIPWHLAPELRTHPDNLVTLCRECHFRFGHFSHWKDCNEHLKIDVRTFRNMIVKHVRSRRNWTV